MTFESHLLILNNKHVSHTGEAWRSWKSNEKVYDLITVYNII